MSLQKHIQLIAQFVTWIAVNKAMSIDEAASYLVALRDNDKLASDALLRDFLRSQK